MIPEQALFYLPEILVGNGYPRSRYEGGIVAAYSLALLQAINGRNIPNPISCLQTERPFRGMDSWSRGKTGKRGYLRSDLYLNTEKIDVVSDRLLNYGWRSRNWIEAKYFRQSTPNRQTNTANLLADLLRLLVLVPNHMVGLTKADRRSTTGRFLLHVYEATTPDQFLAMNRQHGKKSIRRKWLTPLVSGGLAECKTLSLGNDENDGVINAINPNLKDLSFSFTAMSWRIGPTFSSDDDRQYVCILSRIDSFAVSRGPVVLRVSKDRKVSYEPNYKAFVSDLREHVGRWINLKSGLERSKPELQEAERVAVEDEGLHGGRRKGS